MGKEAYFIKQFKSQAIGDDGAVIGNKVYSKDLFCEDIHFKRNWMSLEMIAQKSMLVNISDAIAMNAFPKLALIGIVIPKQFSLEQLKALGRGFESVASRYHIEIIGGDTTSGHKLMISVSIISDVTKPIYRKNAKVGDFVAYTGKLGDSRKDLTRLLRGGIIGKKSKFVTPQLKDKFFYRASKHINAGLDISDGLSKDLSRMCEESKVGINFLHKIAKNILCSGEEYEMLFAFSPRKKAIIERIAKQTRTKVTVFGKLTRKRYRCSCKENHF